MDQVTVFETIVVTIGSIPHEDATTDPLLRVIASIPEEQSKLFTGCGRVGHGSVEAGAVFYQADLSIGREILSDSTDDELTIGSVSEMSVKFTHGKIQDGTAIIDRRISL